MTTPYQEELDSMSPTVAKKKPKPEPPTPPETEPPKRYPSRENVRYLGLPADLYAALERYARSKSDEDDSKSVSWAGRRAVRKFLVDEGFWPPPPE
jgi:hypothetical protein